MERKVGEVFRHNGKVYQCLMSGTCVGCDLNSGGNDCMEISEIRGACLGSLRSDKTPIIFKELTKIGDPIELCNGYYLQKYDLEKSNPAFQEHNSNMFTNETETILYVIVKQNEDMEENKTTLPKEDNALTRIVYDYVNGKISDKELIKSIKEMSDEYPYNKNNLKPFSLELAKQGKPVYTRDGRKARIICFDVKGDKPIIALVEMGTAETPNNYPIDGKAVSAKEASCDLMMLPEKKEGWVNVYKRENEYICENECNVYIGIAVYKSEGEAKRNIDKNEIYINTIKIT